MIVVTHKLIIPTVIFKHARLLNLIKDISDCSTVYSLASACSGGNPAEWIVADVITPTQLRLPRHMQLTIGEVLCH